MKINLLKNVIFYPALFYKRYLPLLPKQNLTSFLAIKTAFIPALIYTSITVVKIFFFQNLIDLSSFSHYFLEAPNNPVAIFVLCLLIIGLIPLAIFIHLKIWQFFLILVLKIFPEKKHIPSKKLLYPLIMCYSSYWFLIIPLIGEILMTLNWLVQTYYGLNKYLKLSKIKSLLCIIIYFLFAVLIFYFL